MQQRNKSWKPLLALMGARLSPSLFAYFHHIMMLVLYLLAGIMLVLLIISEMMVCILVIRHPFKVILPWLQQYGLTFSEAIAFTFGSSVIIYIDVKQAVKHMKGLIALTRADPAQPPPVSLSDYVEVSMPAWLQSLPRVDVPGEMLDTLQQHINPEEPWMKKLEAYLRECAPAYAPTTSILVSLGDRVAVSVLGPGGKRRHITITQEQTAGLIGLLALQEKAAWLRRKQVTRIIYGADDEHVTKHVSRLNASLNKAVREVAAYPGRQDSDQSSDLSENKLRLIEYEESGKENQWRLLTTCDIEIFPEVVILFEQIATATNDPKIPEPDRDTLNSGCHRMLERYGNGLFAYYQKNHPRQYWPWATEYFTRYRDKCLYILEYAAKREWAHAMDNKHTPDVLHTSIRQTAQLYSWSLNVALGIIPHLGHAERAMCMCLKLYRMIGDLTTAQANYQTYATYKIERKNDWEPPAKMTEIWPEASSWPGQNLRASFNTRAPLK